MTCIVGIEAPDGVYLGADTFIGGRSFADSTAGSKLFARNGWHIGVSGGVRIANLLEHVFEWPKAPAAADVATIARIALDLTKLIGADDMCTTSENGQRSLTTEIMLAAGGRIHTLGTTLDVYRSRRGYMAIGSGDQYALGALAATVGMAPRNRVLAALKAAANHCPTVRAPFHVVHVPKKARK